MGIQINTQLHTIPLKYSKLHISREGMKASVRVKCAYSSLHLLHPPLFLPPLLNPLLQKAETANEETEESYFASAQL